MFNADSLSLSTSAKSQAREDQGAAASKAKVLRYLAQPCSTRKDAHGNTIKDTDGQDPFDPTLFHEPNPARNKIFQMDILTREKLTEMINQYLPGTPIGDDRTDIRRLANAGKLSQYNNLGECIQKTGIIPLPDDVINALADDNELWLKLYAKQVIGYNGQLDYVKDLDKSHHVCELYRFFGRILARGIQTHGGQFETNVIRSQDGQTRAWNHIRDLWLNDFSIIYCYAADKIQVYLNDILAMHEWPVETTPQNSGDSKQYLTQGTADTRTPQPAPVDNARPYLTNTQNQDREQMVRFFGEATTAKQVEESTTAYTLWLQELQTAGAINASQRGQETNAMNDMRGEALFRLEMDQVAEIDTGLTA